MLDGRSPEMEKVDLLQTYRVVVLSEKLRQKIGTLSGELALSGCVDRQSALTICITTFIIIIIITTTLQ
jgi:hypothetical protein